MRSNLKMKYCEKYGHHFGHRSSEKVLVCSYPGCRATCRVSDGLVFSSSNQKKQDKVPSAQPDLWSTL
jgi:hypothetical protein